MSNNSTRERKARRAFLKSIQIPYVHYNYLKDKVEMQDACRMLNKKPGEVYLLIADLRDSNPLDRIEGFRKAENGKEYLAKSDFIRLHQYACESYRKVRDHYDQKHPR